MCEALSNTMSTSPARGPAPPLPEKPPSVAERARQLRNSFRKDEAEKPRILDNKTGSPMSDKNTASGYVSNGERSPSPSHSSACNIALTGGIPRHTSQIEKSAAILQQDSNKDTTQKNNGINQPAVCIYLLVFTIVYQLILLLIINCIWQVSFINYIMCNAVCRSCIFISIYKMHD